MLKEDSHRMQTLNDLITERTELLCTAVTSHQIAIDEQGETYIQLRYARTKIDEAIEALQGKESLEIKRKKDKICPAE